MQDGPTISNLPEGRNLTTTTVIMTSPAATVTPGSPLVKVLIKYPADWKKDKFFKDGDVKEVSPETAATFVEIGIATMVDGANEAPVVNASADNGGEGTDDLPPVAEVEPVAEEKEVETTEEVQPATEEKKVSPKKGK